jgi:hypothetical protein
MVSFLDDTIEPEVLKRARCTLDEASVQIADAKYVLAARTLSIEETRQETPSPFIVGNFGEHHEIGDAIECGTR